LKLAQMSDCFAPFNGLQRLLVVSFSPLFPIFSPPCFFLRDLFDDLPNSLSSPHVFFFCKMVPKKPQGGASFPRPPVIARNLLTCRSYTLCKFRRDLFLRFHAELSEGPRDSFFTDQVFFIASSFLEAPAMTGEWELPLFRFCHRSFRKGGAEIANPDIVVVLLVLFPPLLRFPQGGGASTPPLPFLLLNFIDPVRGLAQIPSPFFFLLLFFSNE